MSIFNTILEKLGMQKPAAQKPAAPGPGQHAAPSASAAHMPAVTPGMSGSKPMAMVDVVSKLEKMAGDNPGLDWKVSIVDLLKLLGMDSSLTAREELAKELGCPADQMGGDHSKMNIWLHKTVLQKVADNGGNIPASLLK